MQSKYNIRHTKKNRVAKNIKDLWNQFDASKPTKSIECEIGRAHV